MGGGRWWGSFRARWGTALVLKFVYELSMTSKVIGSLPLIVNSTSIIASGDDMRAKQYLNGYRVYKCGCSRTYVHIGIMAKL